MDEQNCHISQEEWRPIEGYEGYYEVSSEGRVRSLDRKVWNGYNYSLVKGKIKTPELNPHGYYIVMLYKNGRGRTRQIHRLVAMAFIPNPDGKPVIDHIDGSRTNNRVENLHWVTPKENFANPVTRKRFDMSMKRGEEHWSYGKKRPKDVCDKISKTKQERGYTDEQLESMRNRLICAKRVSGGEHYKARRIEQYDLNGSLVRTWDFISEAARHYGICNSAITQNLKGQSRTCAGFVWKYSTT